MILTNKQILTGLLVLGVVYVSCETVRVDDISECWDPASPFSPLTCIVRTDDVPEETSERDADTTTGVEDYVAIRAYAYMWLAEKRIKQGAEIYLLGRQKGEEEREMIRKVTEWLKLTMYLELVGADDLTLLGGESRRIVCSELDYDKNVYVGIQDYISKDECREVLEESVCPEMADQICGK